MTEEVEQVRLACERVLNKQSAGLVIVVEGNANGQFSASGHDERPGGFDFGKCLLVAHRLLSFMMDKTIGSPLVQSHVPGQRP